MAFEIDIKMSGYQGVVEGALREVQEKHIIQRIWEGDYTVWKECPDEITNRLGWLQSAEQMKGVLPEIEDFLDGLQNKGYTDVLLLGMGGSSLAPEVYRKVFGVKPGYLNVTVLDSTDPGAVLSFTHQLKPETTLFIVSTKSGGTVETLSFFQYFYSWMGHKVGVEHTGEHFIAITDPGTFLVKIANTFRFRRVFLNNPNLGGRYSALSCFGLVPAVLMGIDVPLLLERVDLMAKACGPDIPPPGNPAVVLGTLMGELAKNWRDKLTVLLSPSII
ncbi:MAG: glucose-6-phosphate isomerase, partial [Atribacterota bacterium]